MSPDLHQKIDKDFRLFRNYVRKRIERVVSETGSTTARRILVYANGSILSFREIWKQYNEDWRDAFAMTDHIDMDFTQPFMNKEGLRMELERNGIKSIYYNLEGGLSKSDVYTLSFNSGSWEVYYSERGKKNDLVKFNKEEEACRYLISKLQNDVVVMQNRYIQVQFLSRKKVCQPISMTKLLHTDYGLGLKEAFNLNNAVSHGDKPILNLDTKEEAKNLKHKAEEFGYTVIIRKN